MIALTDYQLAIAERIECSSFVRRMAEKYRGSVVGPAASGSDYETLAVRCAIMRCRKNGVVEYPNIEKYLDILFTRNLSDLQMRRLLYVMSDPTCGEEAKMAELSKQFLGERPSQASGFALWKMR